MYYVYIIKSQEGRFYIGSTKNIQKRIQQHNSRQFKGWTRKFSNWQLVYSEQFPNRQEAFIREKQI